MLILEKIWFKLLQIWWDFSVPIRLRGRGVQIGSNVKFFGMPIVSLAPDSKIVIDDDVVLCSDSRFTALGVSHPVVLRTLRPGAEIVIGRASGISGGSVCAAKSVNIGCECMFGADVVVADTDFHAIKAHGRRFNNCDDEILSSPISICNNVFIGSRSTILKGVGIGDNSIVGAGSIVVKSVGDNEVVGGIPAKFLKKI